MDIQNSKFKIQNLSSTGDPNTPTSILPGLSLCIIIPCYNEVKIIGNLILSVKKEFPEATILVIDDCSTDNSTEIIKDTDKAVLLQLPVNLGIGGAVQTGIMYAERNGFEYLIRIDGDGQHPVSEIKKVLHPIISGEADMSIGSRFITKIPNPKSQLISGTSNFKSTPIRRIGILLFWFLNKIILKQDIKDSTSGFRAYNRKLIKYLAKNYPSFDYPEPEEIVLIGLNGFKIKEVSVKMEERKYGSSSIDIFKSCYYMLKVVFAIFMVLIRHRK